MVCDFREPRVYLLAFFIAHYPSFVSTKTIL
jgi:hypothetical protein